MFFSPRFSRFVQAAFFSAAAVVIHGASQGIALAGEIGTQTTLHGGDQFRIIFVTPDKITGSSPTISDYNTFVNTEAAGATYNGVTVHWSAVVSTTTVNAKDNIGLTTSGVYLSNGNEVATSADTNAGGLWAGGSLINQPITDLSNNSYDGSTVWTGTSGVGTTFSSVNGGNTYNWGLGNSQSPIIIGVTDYGNNSGVGLLSSSGTGYNWISNQGNVALNSNSYQIYGISDVLTVVPEPSTFLISGLGILMIGLAQRNRKRN